MFIIEFQSFQIKDKAYIDGFFRIHHYEGIDCTFNTLFLWQKAFHTVWSVVDNILFIRAGEGENSFFMPPFAGEKASFSHGLELIHRYLEERNLPFILKGVSPWVLEQIKCHCARGYDFTADRDNWEYIYRVDDLIRLSGKKFKMKKNHLNSFLREYSDYVYEPITLENREDAKAGIAEWFRRHGSIHEEEVALSTCFDYWDELGMRGALIRIYGKVEAFTAGDLVNDHMAHVIFEKANPTIRGLYQVINRDFLVHEFSDVEFVNREEDLGIEGLRQAKMEYNPDHFAEKYTVVCKGI